MATSAASVLAISRGLVIATASILALYPTLVAALSRYDVVYEWKVIDYNWTEQGDRDKAMESGDYIPENNAISAVKIWKDRIYLSVPRWLPGVPFTLNWVPWIPPYKDHKNKLSNTPLNPFPCKEMQEPGNCSAIQHVKSMEIDKLGRMWVLDVGRRNLLTNETDNTCPPKLVLLDLEEECSAIHTYEFPEEVASRSESILGDLVLDLEGSDWYAYISDCGGTPGKDGAIVVYDLENDQSWRVANSMSMSSESSASHAIVGGKKVSVEYNVHGIAISPFNRKNREVYYSPLASYYFFSIPVPVMRASRNLSEEDIADSIYTYGRKVSQCDGMIMDNRGRLYYGQLTEDAVVRIDRVSLNRRKGERSNTLKENVLVKDKRNEWVDGFGFDNSTYLWFVSNRQQNLHTGQVNTSEVNYRLNRIRTGSKSYMY